MTIPELIHKVLITDDGELPKLPEGMKRAFETWYRMNPGYRIKIYSGNDCIDYIKKHFDEKVLNVYNTLKPYAFKSDLIRQLILYKEGGWYTDTRMICLHPLEILGKTKFLCMYRYATTTIINGEWIYRCDTWSPYYKKDD